MTGACIIDGTDIATLGAIILRGGDHGFISFPSRKQPQMIDWPDQDGFEIGTDGPVYNEKKLTVNYYLKGNETNFQSRLNSFVSLHEASGYRAIEVRELDTTFQLRYAGVSSFSINRGFSATGENVARISIDYIMDNPVQFIGATVLPTAYREIDTQVQIAGTDLSAFGIIVQDIYSSAMRFGIKDRLVYSSAYSTGNIADTSYAPKRGKQELTVRCTMICNDRATFMENYSALFHTIDVASFTLNLAAAGKQFKCYYNAMESFKKRPWTGRAIAGFDIKLIGYRL
jgi:hypothetical protein